MSAALQALEPNDLSSFVVSADYEMAWFPPRIGRVEVKMHPLEILQWSSTLEDKLRAAVRADAFFGEWARTVVEEKRSFFFF